jgi:Flp pilus assembly protein TadG
MPIKLDSILAGLGRSLRRLAGNCEGSEAVEFALISIPLFLFLFGVIEFGRLYWVQSELQYAVEAAARYLTINPSATASVVQTYAATKVLAVSVPTSDFAVTPYNSASNPPTRTCGNQVTVSYQFQFIATDRLIPYGPITLKATGCHNG